MKKIFKRTALLLLVISLLAGLCGCTALDEMRKSQAFLQDDGTILWNGETYKKLPYNEYLSPEIDYEQGVWVTMPDVPLLLMMTESFMTANPSTDGKFLEYEDNYYFYNYYCRASDYDAMCQRLQEEFVPEKVCYYYYTMDEETWEYEELVYTLTQEQEDALSLVMTTVEPVSDIKPAYQDNLSLYDCSADMLMQRYTAELLITGAQYYLMVETEAESLVFSVPEGCNAVFDDIVDAYYSTLASEEDLHT